MLQTISKKFLPIVALIILTCALHSHTKHAFGKPFFAARSQGDNLARRLVGEVNELVPCLKCVNGVISVTPEWNQTFDTKGLGRYFSLRHKRCKGTENPNLILTHIKHHKNSMRFQGSQMGIPEDRTVLADNFLLASTFDGIVKIKPHLKNFILDINSRINLDNACKGLYVEIGMPIVWTSSHVRLKARPLNQPGNIIINASSPRINPFVTPAPTSSIIDAFQGRDYGVLNFTSANTAIVPNPLLIPITVEPMRFAKIKGTQTKSGVADLKFVFGYNAICTQDKHLGINFRITAPVGTRPKGEFVFEPIVGNGRHWAVGAGLECHTELWHHACADRSINVWIDSTIYHLCKAKHTRTFDIQENGIGSRYLLFKQFDAAGNFTNTFVPGPNVTTLPAHVKIKVMGEFVLLLNFKWAPVTFDIGYNLWGRSKEHIKISGNIPTNTYGLLGGTPIDNFLANGTLDPNMPANRTNSAIRINGENSSPFGDGGPGGTPAMPLFITTAHLDATSAQAPSAISNTFFAHLGYIFESCRGAPFIGLGGLVEFSDHNNHALNQWGIWVKGGFAFP